MKIILENTFGIGKDQINIPLVVEDIPMGVVTDVTDENIYILLWDRFITVDTSMNFDKPEDSKITAIQIKHKMSALETINPFGYSNDNIE